VPETIFLETTIQIDKTFQTAARRLRIAENLQGKTIITSTYVLGEYKTTFLKACVVFYNLLFDADTVAEALQRLSRALPRDRDYRRCVMLFAFLLEESGTEKDRLLIRLQRLLEGELARKFYQGVDLVINPTDCFLSRISAKKEGNRYLLINDSCRKNLSQCDICKFWETNRKSLQKVVEGLKTQGDKDLQEKAQVGGETLENLSEALGRRNCSTLADIIIALEAPVEAKIYTTNVKHFFPILKILGKELYEEKNNS